MALVNSWRRKSKNGTKMTNFPFFGHLTGKFGRRLVRSGLCRQPASHCFCRLFLFSAKCREHGAFAERASVSVSQNQTRRPAFLRLSLRANFGISFSQAHRVSKRCREGNDAAIVVVKSRRGRRLVKRFSEQIRTRPADLPNRREFLESTA